MKKYIITVFALLALTACENDLNTLPLNDYDQTSEVAYNNADSYLKGLAYINAYYNFVSQNDPGQSDLSFSDAGQSELLRQWLNLNDLPTGSLDIGWGDSYISSIAAHTWTNADNNAIIAVYTRCMKGIALVNEFLLQTTESKLAARGHNSSAKEVAGYRAEARFHRAMFYYILMDCFGIPPFAMEENIGGELPKQKTRAELAKWIEDELLDLVADGSAMPKKGEVSYPRPNQDACYALLARLYLNDEVYTGTPRWADAKTAAANVIKNGYTLHGNYRELFMQDNGQKCSNDEFIFAVEYDTDHARSWGGTTTLSSGAFDDATNAAVVTYLKATSFPELATPYVSAEVWNGYHMDPAWASANLEIKGLGTMRFSLSAKTVADVNDVKTSLIKTRRIVFTPAVELKNELANTAIIITCYDRNGNEVKRVTSADPGTVEDNEDEGTNTGTSTNQGGTTNESNGGGSGTGTVTPGGNTGGDNGGDNGGDPDAGDFGG